MDLTATTYEGSTCDLSRNFEENNKSTDDPVYHPLSIAAEMP